MIALDIAKFRKVHALMTGGATAGERAAAKVHAGKIAARAGMSLDQAASEMDKPATVFAKPAKGFFDDFEDWMEKKEPGYKAKEAAKRSERQERYAKRRAEILKEFGSVRAFLDPTPRELLLLSAGAPFVTKRVSFIDACGTNRQCASDFAGV
ncbi:MAG: winged helix-turn-helix domain-containing protein, partial [Rhizobiaceae bacterium]|nr:winged helix-turn-helix domain-containing protein [Rhizobiaceae bacterium]